MSPISIKKAISIVLIYICTFSHCLGAAPLNPQPFLHIAKSTLSPALNIDMQSFNNTYLSALNIYSSNDSSAISSLTGKDYFSKKHFDTFAFFAGKSVAIIVAPACILISLLIAPLIYFSSPGPIFFLQKRIGYKGETFLMFKFRTMSNDKNPDNRTITPFGKILRATALDEIPQLINILKGEMNWFGPRPYMPEIVSALYTKEVLNNTAPGLFSTSISKKGIGKSLYLPAEATMPYDIMDIQKRSPEHYLKILWGNIHQLLKSLFPSFLNTDSQADIAEIIELMDKNAIDRLNFSSETDRINILNHVDNFINKNSFRSSPGKIIYILLRLIILSPKKTLPGISCISPETKQNIYKLLSSDRSDIGMVDLAKEIIASQIEQGIYRGWNVNNVSLKGMPKALLIGSFEDGKVKTGSFVSPPIGIYRIQSFLQQLGIDSQVYDPNLYGQEGLSLILKNTNFDFLMFSSYHPTYKNDAELILRAKELAPDSLIIAGNEGAAFSPERYLGTLPVDAVCRGLGEFPMAKMIVEHDKKIQAKDQIKDIPGLYVLNNKGLIATTAIPSTISNRDFRVIQFSINFKRIPYELYWNRIIKSYPVEKPEDTKSNHMIKTIRIMPDTHCALQCSFCSASIFLNQSLDGKNHPPRMLSAQDIKELMDNSLSEHPDTEAFLIHSDDFLVSKKRIYAFADLIEADQKYKNIKFITQGNVRHADEKILQRLKEIGFIKISYGIESFSEKILSDMNKGNTPEDNKRVIRQTINAGIVPMMNIMLGYPTATLEDELKTIDSAIEMVRAGAEVLVSPRVWALPKTLATRQAKNFEYQNLLVGNSHLQLPLFIEPENEELSIIIKKASRIFPELIETIKRKYSTNNSLTPNIKNLIYFSAIHQAANIPATNLNQLIESMLLPSKKDETTIKKHNQLPDQSMLILQAI